MSKRNIESIKELRKICQESRYESEMPWSWIEKNFYRRISIYFTNIFLKIDFSANKVTLLSLIFALLGGLFLIFTNIMYWVISALFLYIYLVFDCVDGEIARYNKSSSKLGAHFDFMVGATVHPYIIICMTFGIYNALQDTIIFIFGFLAVILNLLHEMHRISYENKFSDISFDKDTSEKKGIIGKYVYRSVKRICSFLGPGAIIYAILIVTALDICFTPISIGHVPIIGLFIINARYAFLILYSVGKIGSFVVKIHGLFQ